MTEFAQQLIFGISVGSIYALIALAITLVYRAMDLINFAQGELFMAGAFIGYQIFAHFSTPIWITFPLTIIIAFALGSLLERIFLRKLEDQTDGLSLLVMTIALFIILPNAVLLIFGADAYILPPVSNHTFQVGLLRISSQHILVIATALVLMVLLYILFTKTSFGLSLRAVAQDKVAARMMGINVSRANNFTYALSSVLGAVAALVYAPLIVITFDMGGTVMLKGFTAAVLGGLGLVSGAVVGGFLLGIIEQFSTLLLNSAYKDLVSFGILLIIILLRPNGLLGKRSITKV